MWPNRSRSSKFHRINPSLNPPLLSPVMPFTDAYHSILVLCLSTAILCAIVDAANISNLFNSFPSSPHSSSHLLLNNLSHLSQPSEEATIAYFIQVSDPSVPLTLRLLSRLHHPANFYAIHFDHKIPTYKVFHVIATIKDNPLYSNVHIMDRETVTYRGITMVLNTMAAITDLLSQGNWHYFINLSGSDYPLLSPIMQRKLLAMPHVRERQSNFFIVSPPQQWQQSKRYRFDRIAVDTALGLSHTPSDSKLVILDQNTPLSHKLNYHFVKGEGWLILTRRACNFMIRSAYARKMLLSMAYSQEPSEHYYVSLFWNHPDFNRTIIPHSLRTVYWRLNGVDSGQHPYVIDQLRASDGSYNIWPWLKISPHWFARKFSLPNSDILDWIDNEMNGLGQNVNHTSVQHSLHRVVHHMHWLFGILPKAEHDAETKRTEDQWPSR